MKSKSTQEYQKSLVKVDLEWLLDPEEPLYKLSNKINWSVFEEEFAYSLNQGRPALPIRLMVGLHYLKSAYGESNESVVERWKCNPYWQYFCGEREFQHKCPCDHSTLAKWSDRVKGQGLEILLKQTIECGLKATVINS